MCPSLAKPYGPFWTGQYKRKLEELTRKERKLRVNYVFPLIYSKENER